jgi:alkanesulfonate monooxygenase SsuD/methylene tetrahydromethanopterin reductase-like flavin-dependent oxidoreductase (luciferase family)
LIIKAWTEPAPFGWEGEFYKFRAVSLWPKPMQKPHPPILYSGSNPDSARTAARNRMMLGMVFIPNLEAGRGVIEAYIDEARKCGWEPGPEHTSADFIPASPKPTRRRASIWRAASNISCRC